VLRTSRPTTLPTLPSHCHVSVCRHVCRGCKVNQLSSNIFWFKKPGLLLHPIKYLVFLTSFIFASAVRGLLKGARARDSAGGSGGGGGWVSVPAGR